ncbi:MAG: hypothetical protein GEU90_13130 [Gemmatimonas sp.]|nr:hypothetical protein [Gemmatimonas sp.]
MGSRRRVLLLVGVLLVAPDGPALAQDRIPALENFVEQVAGLWAEADVGALVALISEDDPIVLDAGNGTQSANSRHAAAALRALFAEHETIDARTLAVSMASTTPLRGFGEIAWTFRARGAPGEQSRSVYVAALQEDGSWRITELRLLR